jgi:hypothetical protein
MNFCHLVEELLGAKKTHRHDYAMLLYTRLSFSSEVQWKQTVVFVALFTVICGKSENMYFVMAWLNNVLIYQTANYINILEL